MLARTGPWWRVPTWMRLAGPMGRLAGSAVGRAAGRFGVAREIARRRVTAFGKARPRRRRAQRAAIVLGATAGAVAATGTIDRARVSRLVR
ncbi:hypothetical protein AAHH97_18015 [Mycolicibacterium elephantis]|uniref:hypothetical protein n=1 Tax=Mycolicibacterium elephantis TaxID=81858 RepID=UPI003A89185D